MNRVVILLTPHQLEALDGEDALAELYATGELRGRRLFAVGHAKMGTSEVWPVLALVDQDGAR